MHVGFRLLITLVIVLVAKRRGGGKALCPALSAMLVRNDDTQAQGAPADTVHG